MKLLFTLLAGLCCCGCATMHPDEKGRPSLDLVKTKNPDGTETKLLVRGRGLQFRMTF